MRLTAATDQQHEGNCNAHQHARLDSQAKYRQKGKAKGGGDRIRPGTKKGNAYCARSAKIKKCKNPPCANALSRKKWKCQGSRSVAESLKEMLQKRAGIIK